MAAISDLLERVAKATEGSRRLDAWVDVVIANPTEWNWQIRENPDRILDPSTYTERAFPRYTVSIDAALALVERKLPGWVLTSLSSGNIDLRYMDVRRFTGWQCMLAPEGASIATPQDAIRYPACSAPTAPLAIITALLRALESETPA